MISKTYEHCEAMPLEGHKQISTDAKYERQKPPHSYIALIATAILSSTEKKLTLTEINEYLIKNYAFFRGSYQGWKNSVRHNLSFNKCFVKILRDPSRPWGKDNYWTVCSLRDYLLSDGTFRRRRKRKPKRKEEEEEEASEAPNQLEENSTGRKPKLVKARFSLPTQAVQSDRTQRDVFAESKSTAPRFRGAFSIASILSDERRNEERPARIYHIATPVQASRQIGPVVPHCCCSRFHVCHEPLYPSVPQNYEFWSADCYYRPTSHCSC